MGEIKIGVDYVKNGKKLDYYPSSANQFIGVEVEYVTMAGWKQDISACRKFEDLPDNAKTYVKKIEELLGVSVRWVGVGQSRDSMIFRPEA